MSEFGNRAWIPRNQTVAGTQFLMGVAYQNGEGVEPSDKSDEEAVRWYQLAADQGHADALFYLGFAYTYGKGVQQSNEEGVRWYRRAADQGHADAQFWLGIAYEDGEGVEPSDEEAVRWYKLAADQGHEKARFNLTSLRKAISFRDFNPDEKEIEAAFAAAEAKAAEHK